MDDTILEQFGKLLADGHNSAIQSAEASLRAARNAYQNVCARLRKAYDDYLDAERALAAIRSDADYDREQELDRIRKIKQIDNIKFIERSPSEGESSPRTCLVCTTRPLTFVDPRPEAEGRRHYLGVLDIEIDLRRKEVTFTHNEFRTFAYTSCWSHAPHVDESGRPCLGNIRNILYDCLLERRIYQAIITAISFLETVNTADSAGRLCSRWPYFDDVEVGPPIVKYCPEHFSPWESFTIPPSWVAVDRREWPIVVHRWSPEDGYLDEEEGDEEEEDQYIADEEIV